MSSARRIAASRPAADGAEARLDAGAREVHEALSALVRVYQFRDRDRICCHDISVTQCHALEALVRRGPSALNDLARELYLDKSTASRVVSALERKGYVRRSAHPDDGRAVILDLTAAGRRLHDRIRADLIAETRRLIADLEPGVQEGTARLLLRLARAAAERSGVGVGDGESCCGPQGYG